MVTNILAHFSQPYTTFVTFATCAQLLVSVDAGVMAVFPHRRQTVATNRLYVNQRRLLNAQALLFGEHSGQAALACAPGTRTGPAQRFPTVYALMLIAPRQDELPMLLVQQK